jgi:hypothetical protein
MESLIITTTRGIMMMRRRMGLEMTLFPIQYIYNNSNVKQ